jgi:hypothetical protein
MKINAHDYLGSRTLIMGDVNSGKTSLTRSIAEAIIRTGDSGQMVVLDLAPETTKGIGGTLKLPESHCCRLLRCAVTPPRLTGTTAAEIQALAEQNAQAIEPLLETAGKTRGEVLVVNDASLYLQAGPLDRLTAVMAAYATVMVNAYFGRSFRPAPFTQFERDQVNALAQWCDHVIRLKKQQHMGGR